jgi:hypothetical protein
MSCLVGGDREYPHDHVNDQAGGEFYYIDVAHDRIVLAETFVLKVNCDILFRKVKPDLGQV